ncbi:hypothetical protein [Bradyrhizobium arachidis]|uniref:hypothetical protein n=1 Tax=Bradyrhizobium arachidis TaxID=858423 RepID=UPI0008F45230|nr:hypothetical protein [Bradyrhizobium arachidis]SFV15008.1 hypothetical protein SAMN05192541_122100 [Bradyrhizobium arachidis]
MTLAANDTRASRCLQMDDPTATQKGIHLLIGFDFHEYLSITQATPTKGPTYPNFRPDTSPIKSGEGYWIAGLDRRNDVAILAAARLYDLSYTNFAAHLQSLNAFYAEPDKHAHPQDRCVCTAPSAKKITGKVAYHGDFWIRKDFRGQGISKMSARIAHLVSFILWKPDFLCGLVPSWSVEKGIVTEYGYEHLEKGGSILRLVKEDIVDDDWLIWRTGEKLRSQFDRRCDLTLVPSNTLK